MWLYTRLDSSPALSLRTGARGGCQSHAPDTAGLRCGLRRRAARAALQREPVSLPHLRHHCGLRRRAFAIPTASNQCAISVQSVCNPCAISVQSVCNQRALVC